MTYTLPGQYGSTFKPIDEISHLRSTGKWNPPMSHPLTSAKNLKQDAENWESRRDQIAKSFCLKNQDPVTNWSCTVLDKSQQFNERTLHTRGNFLLQLFFSEVNIKHIKQRIREELKKQRNVETDLVKDSDSITNLMQYTFELTYKGKVPAVTIGSDKCTVTSILSNLNRHVINYYLKEAIGEIDMRKHYLNDISSLPVPFELPLNVNITGSNCLMLPVAFESVTELNRQIREHNNEFVRISS